MNVQLRGMKSMSSAAQAPPPPVPRASPTPRSENPRAGRPAGPGPGLPACRSVAQARLGFVQPGVTWRQTPWGQRLSVCSGRERAPPTILPHPTGPPPDRQPPIPSTGSFFSSVNLRSSPQLHLRRQTQRRGGGGAQPQRVYGNHPAPAESVSTSM